MPRPNPGPRLKWLDKRGVYYIHWYEAGAERQRSTGTADRSDAEDALANFLRERRHYHRPDRPRDPDQVMIADVLDQYGQEHAPSTLDPARIGYAMDALLPFWGERTVASITRQTCRQYTTERKRAPATMRRELSTLKAALNHAVAEKRLTSAPKVYLPEKPEGRDRWLTRSEAARLLNAARTGRSDVRLYLPLFIVIGLYTGARSEAILSLRWPQVDLERARIDFRNGQTSNKRRGVRPIPRRLLTFLQLARRRGSDLGYVIHDAGRRILDIGGGWDGETKRGHGSFGSACSRAGLAGVSPHTLRHTCGTWLAQAGVPLHDIGGWLEHSDARTTALYAHHHPDYQAGPVSALDRKANRSGPIRERKVGNPDDSPDRPATNGRNARVSD